MSPSDQRNSIFVSVFVLSLLVVPSIILKNEAMKYCCENASVEDIDRGKFLTGRGKQSVITYDLAARIAAKHAGGSVIDNDFLDRNNNPMYRVKTVTKNSRKIYVTWVDAQTSQVKFSDETWRLADLL